MQIEIAVPDTIRAQSHMPKVGCVGDRTNIASEPH
jgi:hypothetical protein